MADTATLVRFSRIAEKQIKKLPINIRVFLQEWVRAVELEGIYRTQQLRKYRDHSLNDKIRIVEVLEVTNHEYRTKK